MEKMLNSRSVLQQAHDEVQKNLREIGSLPAKSQKEYAFPPKPTFPTSLLVELCL